jgi:N-acetylglucosamine kinase-like BadF-type ATPase
MRYVAGIDGGQSSTAAAIVDEHGTVVGRGIAGAADHVGEPPGSERCARACTDALSAAAAAAGLPAGQRFAAIVAGISGYDDDFSGALPALPADRVRLVHDAPIALAGAVAERPAIVIIAGTGSVAYGEDAHGRAVRVGGWGYLFDDAGSAYAIARDALATAMRADDAGETSAIGDAARDFFACATLRALAGAALSGTIARSALAAFSPRVHELTDAGDADALLIVADAADALASLAARTIARLGLARQPVPVALSGGNFGRAAFFDLVAARLGVHAPHAHAVRPRADAAAGAALLAFDDAGLARPAILRG